MKENKFPRESENDGANQIRNPLLQDGVHSDFTRRKEREYLPARQSLHSQFLGIWNYVSRASPKEAATAIRTSSSESCRFPGPVATLSSIVPKVEVLPSAELTKVEELPKLDEELRSAGVRPGSSAETRKMVEAELMIMGFTELAKVSLILSCKLS